MRRLAYLLSSVALAAGMLTPTPAEANEWDTVWPTVIPWLMGDDRTVVYEYVTPISEIWAFQLAVASWDRRVAGLDLQVGLCADNPRARCIHVSEGHHGSDFGGEYGIVVDWAGPDGTITLNSDNAVHRTTARTTSCHEIGHSLGLTHHSRGFGCLSTVRAATRFPGQAEVDVLSAFYGGAPAPVRPTRPWGIR